MDKWTQRALAKYVDMPVPIVPIGPIAPLIDAIDPNGPIGTARTNRDWQYLRLPDGRRRWAVDVGPKGSVAVSPPALALIARLRRDRVVLVADHRRLVVCAQPTWDQRGLDEIAQHATVIVDALHEASDARMEKRNQVA
jgi:hypothetical protein